MYIKNRNKNVRLINIGTIKYLNKFKRNEDVDFIIRMTITTLWCISYLYVNNNIFTVGCILSTFIVNVSIRLLQESTKGQ